MPQLLDDVRDRIRARHYSIRTEETYLRWMKDFILFHGKRHPREMGAHEVRDYLSHLAIRRNVAASTQNQALSAIRFNYRGVPGVELPAVVCVVRAKRPVRVAVVCEHDGD